MSDRLAIVGPGRTGVALGYALWKAGAVEALTYYGRHPEPPVHPVFFETPAQYVHGLARPGEGTTAVFLAVADRAIAEVAAALARQGPAPQDCAAFHLSGALTTEVLQPLHMAGYRVGSVHPLLSLADSPAAADLLRGAFFAVAGEPEARATARRLLLGIEGRMVSVSERMRPVYHAAAVMAAGYLTALVVKASRLLVEAGVRREDALPAVLPLARSALDNLERVGVPGALTGPIVRGDVEVIRMHLQALPDAERPLYCALGQAALELASERDLDAGAVAEMRALLTERSG
ncbi:MAG: DUF2520 domain-containing protein [Gemmatimonadetes bacterium]|nr:DUF2520 domain-containing protein [Gemmatimonadota bacterium]